MSFRHAVELLQAGHSLAAGVLGGSVAVVVKRTTVRSLLQDPSGELKEEHFLHLLRESLDSDEAERVLNVAIEWGRHGEVYGYDYNTGMIQLPESPFTDDRNTH